MGNTKYMWGKSMVWERGPSFKVFPYLKIRSRKRPPKIAHDVRKTTKEEEKERVWGLGFKERVRGHLPKVSGQLNEMRIETSHGNTMVTGDLSKTTSLRLGKSDWNGLQSRTEFGRAVNTINSQRSVIVRRSGKLKVATQEEYGIKEFCLLFFVYLFIGITGTNFKIEEKGL